MVAILAIAALVAIGLGWFAGWWGGRHVERGAWAFYSRFLLVFSGIGLLFLLVLALN